MRFVEFFAHVSVSIRTQYRFLPASNFHLSQAVDLIFSHSQITAVGDGLVAVRLQEHHWHIADLLRTGKCKAAMSRDENGIFRIMHV